jgi:hypothetical protein
MGRVYVFQQANGSNRQYKGSKAKADEVVRNLSELGAMLKELNSKINSLSKLLQCECSLYHICISALASNTVPRNY